MKYDEFKIAKYLYNNCDNMSNIKLQKMMFFAFINYYLKTGKELFDDNFEAWIYSPVLPNIYKNISNIFFSLDFQEVENYITLNKLNTFLDNIILKYGWIKPFDLNEVIKQDEIWENARQGLKPWENSNKKLNIVKNINLYIEYHRLKKEIKNEKLI